MWASNLDEGVANGSSLAKFFACFDTGITGITRIGSTWHSRRRFLARKDGAYLLVWLNFQRNSSVECHSHPTITIFCCLFTGGTMSVSASCTTRLCAGCFVLFAVRDVVNWFFRVWLHILRQEHIWQCWLLVLVWCFLYRLPNGKPDPKSKHGGCPVLSGVKVSANEQRATQSITDCTITFVDSCYPQHSYNGFFLVLIVFLFR